MVADEQEARDYALYVEAKEEIDEEPLTIEQWRDFNEYEAALEASR